MLEYSVVSAGKQLPICQKSVVAATLEQNCLKIQLIILADLEDEGHTSVREVWKIFTFRHGFSLQNGYIFVTEQLHLHYRTVTSSLQNSYISITEQLRLHYRTVTSSLQNSYIFITEQLHLHYRTVTASLQNSYSFITEQLHLHYRTVTASPTPM